MKSFICKCTASKKYHLEFDGGVIGHYSVTLCQGCYERQEKKFLIREEIIK